jgi:hypothetical protein
MGHFPYTSFIGFETQVPVDWVTAERLSSNPEFYSSLEILRNKVSSTPDVKWWVYLFGADPGETVNIVAHQSYIKSTYESVGVQVIDCMSLRNEVVKVVWVNLPSNTIRFKLKEPNSI